MKFAFFIILLSFIFIFQAFALEASGNEIIHLLLNSLQSISIQKTSKKDIQEKLGNAGLTEGQRSYYQIGKLKYDFEIVYQRNMVSEFSFTFSQNHPLLKDLGIHLDEKKLKSFSVNDFSTKYFIYNYLSYDLVINPIDMSIYSVKVHK